MTSFIIFLSCFLVAYFFLNFYVIRRLLWLFEVKHRWWLYIIYPVAALSYFTAAGLQEISGHWLIRVYYILAASWMGIGLILLCCLVCYEILRLTLKPSKRLARWVIVAVTCSVSIYAMINARVLYITEVEIEAPVNMTIAQISDVHLGSVNKAFLKRVVRRTNALSPDVILITGDLVDSHGTLNGGTLTPLDDLIAPVFFVTGNHEGYAGLDKFINILKTTKAKPLRNEAIDFMDIQIIGIDDSYNRDQVAKQLKNITVDNSKFSILMYHRPNGIADAENAGIDLMLSGHTHNGQIWPFNFAVRTLFKDLKGLYTHGSCKLFVTTGTGTWGPRMRIGSKSEIVLIKLKKK